MYKSHKVIFKSYASYITLNKLTPKTKNIWIIFHGYGQLSKFFIRRFDILDQNENFIIAPQGLSKFYTYKDYKNPYKKNFAFYLFSKIKIHYLIFLKKNYYVIKTLEGT